MDGATDWWSRGEFARRGARNGMGVDLVPDIQRPRQRLKPFAGTAPSANSKVGKSVHSEAARSALSAQTARLRHKEARNASTRRGHSPRRERSDAKGLLPGPLFGKRRLSPICLKGSSLACVLRFSAASRLQESRVRRRRWNHRATRRKGAAVLSGSLRDGRVLATGCGRRRSRDGLFSRA